MTPYEYHGGMRGKKGDHYTTAIATIDQQPFEEVYPGERNLFTCYHEAFNWVATKRGHRRSSVKTKKIS